MAISLAWACTPQADLTANPRSGAAGSSVIVHGGQFLEGPVQIRWGSATGRVLATAQGPAFVATVKVPNVPTDAYALVATSTDSTTGKVYAAPASFEVTTPSSSGPRRPVPQSTESGAAALQPTGGGPTSIGTDGGRRSTGSGQTALTASGRERSIPGTLPAPVARSRTRGADSVATAGPGRVESRAPAVPSAPAAAGGSNAPAFVTTPSGQRAFGHSAADAPDGRASRGAHADVVAAVRAASPREGSVSGDLWSGFRSSSSPSLVPGSTDAVPSASPPATELTIGVGLLGLGLVALFGGSLVAELRRRRARAQSGVSDR